MPNPSTIESADENGTTVNVVNQALEVPDTTEEIQELIDSVPVIVSETKKYYRTSEFWVSVIASVAVVFNGIPAPESKEGYIVAALAAAYAIARGIAKNGVAHVEPK